MFKKIISDQDLFRTIRKATSIVHTITYEHMNYVPAIEGLGFTFSFS